MSRKLTISKNERLQLIGLMFLARQHAEAMQDCERAMGEITGELDDAGYAGHLSDEVFSQVSMDTILRRLNIKVK